MSRCAVLPLPRPHVLGFVVLCTLGHLAVDDRERECVTCLPGGEMWWASRSVSRSCSASLTVRGVHPSLLRLLGAGQWCVALWQHSSQIGSTQTHTESPTDTSGARDTNHEAGAPEAGSHSEARARASHRRERAEHHQPRTEREKTPCEAGASRGAKPHQLTPRRQHPQRARPTPAW